MAKGRKSFTGDRGICSRSELEENYREAIESVFFLVWQLSIQTA